jgi:hypothetical protein
MIPAVTALLLCALGCLSFALTWSVLNRWMPAPDLGEGVCWCCGNHGQTYDGLCDGCFDNQ